jgi:hypothetical protein
MQAIVRGGVRAVIELGFAFLSGPRTVPVVTTDERPQRRWRVKA